MQGQIIEFWRAVEMFSPPAIPAARPSQRVFDLVADQPLPWEAGHPLRRERLTKDRAWRYTVYVGLYPLESVFGALRSVFPAATDSFEERPAGSSALLTFAVSEKGTMLKGSPVLSACAWATARALDPGPSSKGWLDGFSDVEGDFAFQLEENYLGPELSPVVFDWDALEGCRKAAVDALGVADVLPVAGFRVRGESSRGEAPMWSSTTSSTASSPTTSAASRRRRSRAESAPPCAST